LIKTHYRANADFSMQGLKDSGRTVDRWRQFVAMARTASGHGPRDCAARDAVREAFVRAMSDDLNTAGAIGAINAWINATPEPTAADAELFGVFDAVLGVAALEPLGQKQTGIALYLAGAEPSEEVEDMLVERRDAKKSKDFAASDAIRDRLRGMGYAIKDTPGGRVEVGPVG
jgi:cysteinyl-tRNA synthetase